MKSFFMKELNRIKQFLHVLGHYFDTKQHKHTNSNINTHTNTHTQTHKLTHTFNFHQYR